MTKLQRWCAALWALALAVPAAAAGAAAPDGAPPPQTVVLKVGVDAAGKVQTTASLDAEAVPAYLQAAEGYARRLVFTPAKKGGVAVPSETWLSLVIAAEPVGDGKFGLKLRRAINGPGVASLGKMELPKYKVGGATIVVSVEVDAQGKPDMDTFKSESVKLRDANSFAEARYLDAIRNSVKHSTFVPDKVAGAAVPSRITLPYRFGMGGDKPKPGEEEEERGRGRKPKAFDPSDQPTMQGMSLQPDVELPKVDYKAPAPGA